MGGEGAPGLLQSFFGSWARKRPDRSTPASLQAQARNAWGRADTYIQYETDNFDDVDPAEAEKCLIAIENSIPHDPDLDSDAQQDPDNHLPYPKLRRMIQKPDAASNIPTSRRKRKHLDDTILEETSNLEMHRRKKRVLPRQETEVDDKIGAPEADLAILTRRHSMLLHQGLRTQWSCICQKCEALSVRLSLPRREKSSQSETCFEVSFGIRSFRAITQQEGKITVKDRRNENTAGSSELASNNHTQPTHICQSISDSLAYGNCLHLLYEDGSFKRLRPQPKTLDDAEMPGMVSLADIFKRQQELHGGSPVLPQKGKRILALTLATALLPFLETPWVRPSFNHSNIYFIQPIQEGELPDITKPFLAVEQAPIISARKTSTGGNQDESLQQMTHPNTSVMALGILLCELQYCRPIGSWQTDAETARHINADYYTSLNLLHDLKAEAGTDYYLATQACLRWEYFPTGDPDAKFESTDVQRLFYQNVIKRLESDIKLWKLRPEDLNAFDSRENESCWSSAARELIRQHASKPLSNARSNEGSAVPSPPAHNSTSTKSALNSKPADMHVSVQRPPPIDSSTEGMQFFDASHSAATPLDTALSDRWMDSLSSSIHTHVDPFGTAATELSPRSTVNFPRNLQPIRIAILDSGVDPNNPLLFNDDGQRDPRIMEARNFVPGSGLFDFQDEIGHGTHALGLLLRFATCAEIYIAKISSQDTLSRDSYDTIAEAINHAVTEWKVDVITMSFGIREYHERIKNAISTASHNKVLMFAAASNGGANLGRAFPAKDSDVFCIHATDGNGNPSAFNPTADEKDVNFSLLGEHVTSYWPRGKKGHDDDVNVMSGTSVATPIAAGLAASVISFVRQQEQDLSTESEKLGSWIKDADAMKAILNKMVKRRRGGYDYITPHILLDTKSTKQEVYNKIKDIKKDMYMYD